MVLKERRSLGVLYIAIGRVGFQKKVVLPERFVTKYLKGMDWEKGGVERNGVYHIEI